MSNKYKEFSKIENNESELVNVTIKTLNEYRLMSLKDTILDINQGIENTYCSKEDLVNHVFDGCLHKPTFDYALPHSWIESMREFNNEIIGVIPDNNISLHFIWVYPSGALKNSGYAMPLTLEGLMLLSAFSMWNK